MTRIGIIGAGGRMGRAIADAAAAAGATVAGGIGRDGAATGEHDDAASLAGASDVLVDFSLPAALPASLAAAQAARIALVVGTTGLQDSDHRLIDEAARAIPVLQAANTSLGIALLRKLVEQAAATLGPDWDIEILDIHHRDKIDAPSGTAFLLGAAAAEARGSSIETLSRLDRIGNGAPREAGTIGYAALRGGTIAGEHQVIFAGDGERVELAHRADSRTIFAKGAVKAARWIVGKPAGRYTMSDVLGL